MITPYWLNTFWMASCATEARAFRRATRCVRQTQLQLLLGLLRDNQSTWYGREYGFGQIATSTEFQQRVPMTNGDQAREPIQRIADGETNVLTFEQVMLLEPTGGSTNAEKLIPYTNTLRKQFQRGLAVWIYDVMNCLPAARRGRAYWSISPIAETARRSAGGIPIGFEDDREYLGAWQRWAVSKLLVVPPHVRHLRSSTNARYVTLLHLLSSRDLSLVSIWSPTYLNALLKNLSDWLEPICADLRAGRTRLPQPEQEPVDCELPLRRCVDRADELFRIFGGSQSMPDKLAECWPQLALISCWADAASEMYVPPLKSLFPGVLLQPKGLLATEGIVSFPLMSMTGSVLAIRSHFFEFVDTASGKIQLADELELNCRYRVVITTGGGLYRYDLGDEVEVVGYHHDCPRIRFLGRSNAISDLVGEKLNERHVRDSIRRACQELGIKPEFVLLAPTRNLPANYRLFLECGDQPGGSMFPRNLARRLEEQLRTNPHYRIAISSGQLSEVDVRLLESPGWERYQKVCVGRGQKIGDIKPAVLDMWNGWDGIFS